MPPIPPALRARLVEALPGARPDAAEEIGRGWSAIAYRVPDRDDRGGDWVLRIPHGDSFEQVTGDIEREVRLLPVLEAAGLPTPREARGLYSDGGELLAALHRLVEGEPATPDRARGRGGRRWRTALARRMGEFLAALHAIPAPVARAAGVREVDLWTERYLPMLEACRSLLGPRSIEWLDATVARFVAEGGMDGAPRVLHHGDLAAEHILVDEAGELSGVIDFGDALIADPALDFGALLVAYGPAFMERTIEAYEACGGEIDPHLRRRARFYADVVPVFLVRYGHAFNDGQDRIDGLRQFAARAAAATRRTARA